MLPDFGAIEEGIKWSLQAAARHKFLDGRQQQDSPTAIQYSGDIMT